jgi:hypothetical protein
MLHVASVKEERAYERMQSSVVIQRGNQAALN